MASQPYGICAFCGLYKKMTDEDVIARWIGPLLGRSTAKNHQRGAIHFVPNSSGSVTPLQVTWRRPGHAASLKIPHVCADCNNQWMSHLEIKNKAVLSALIKGQSLILTPFILRNLVGWVAKTAMMAEFHDPSTVCVPQAHRDHLRLHKVPPPDGWNIWMAPYEGPQWALKVFRHGLHMPPKRPEDRIPGDMTRNTQQIMIAVGHVVFYIISSTSEGHTFTLGNERLADFRRIWPMPIGVQPFPRGRYLTTRELVRMIDSFNSWAGVPKLHTLDGE